LARSKKQCRVTGEPRSWKGRASSRSGVEKRRYEKARAHVGHEGNSAKRVCRRDEEGSRSGLSRERRSHCRKGKPTVKVPPSPQSKAGKEEFKGSSVLRARG